MLVILKVNTDKAQQDQKYEIIVAHQLFGDSNLNLQTLAGDIMGKRDRGWQQVTYLMSLFEMMVEWWEVGAWQKEKC